MTYQLPLNILLVFITLLSGCSQDPTQPTLESITSSVKTTRPEEAFPNQRGVTERAYLNGQQIRYQLIGDQAVFESDILLWSDNLQDQLDVHTDGTGRTRASAKWPNKIIYYSIDPSLPNQVRVKDAMAHWETNTPIRFVPRTSQRGYVLFRLGSGCSSNIGYSGGQQFINLGNGCSTGNAIHEIGHTIGLWHEQSRVDRDIYIQINTANITAGYETDFQTYTQRGLDGFDYQGGLDFGSIMMYSSYDFSKNGQPTITKEDGSTFLSQRSALSKTDIETVLSMYP